MLVTKNNQAVCALETKPNNWYAGLLYKVPETLNNIKTFYGCRIRMEMLMYKDCYEQNWRNKDTVTPWFAEVSDRDHYYLVI